MGRRHRHLQALSIRGAHVYNERNRGRRDDLYGRAIFRGLLASLRCSQSGLSGRSLRSNWKVLHCRSTNLCDIRESCDLHFFDPTNQPRKELDLIRYLFCPIWREFSFVFYLHDSAPQRCDDKPRSHQGLSRLETFANDLGCNDKCAHQSDKEKEIACVRWVRLILKRRYGSHDATENVFAHSYNAISPARPFFLTFIVSELVFDLVETVLEQSSRRISLRQLGRVRHWQLLTKECPERHLSTPTTLISHSVRSSRASRARVRMRCQRMAVALRKIADFVGQQKRRPKAAFQDR